MNVFNRSLLLTAGLMVTMMPVSGFAEDENAGSRYTMEKTEAGIVRLDTRTGAVTLCSIDNAQLVCRMAADERAAFEQELNLLSDRVTALEKTAAQAPIARLPTDEELDRSMSFMEKMLKRFMGTMQELEKSQNHEALPQKT
jgi:hypothetical protein